jgi:hypothetical protein
LDIALKAALSSGQTVNKEVVFLPGEHFIPEPVVLKPAHSGISITSENSAFLFGGIPVRGWVKDGKNWRLQLSPSVKWNFRSVMINGRMSLPARYPEKDVLKHLNEFTVPWMSTSGGGWKRKPTHKELTTMKYRPGDLKKLNLQGAEITVYHSWDESRVGVEKIDHKSSTLFFSAPLGHPAGAFGIKKYVLWNVKESLSPGCWYFNKSQSLLFYRPLPEEDISTTETIIPTTESIIISNEDAKHPVKDVGIKNLNISSTTTPLTSGGFGACNYAGALTFNSMEGLQLEKLSVSNTSGYGIKVLNSRNTQIKNCKVFQTGAGGIRVAGGEMPSIKGNHIFQTGRIYPSGIALSCSSRRASIKRNRIHDTSYSGITCTGDDTIIEENLIYRVMQELHDGGAIYTSFCENVVIRNNRIHNISSPEGTQSHGYYLDEKSSGCKVENNLSIDVDWPLHNHMAYNNTIRKNFFQNSGDLYISFPRSEGSVMENNVLCSGGKIVIRGPEGVGRWKNNLFYSKKRRYIQFSLSPGGYKVIGKKTSLPEGTIND